MRLTARVNRDTDGSYWAQVNELPGCFASGFSMDELVEDLRGSIQIYLQKDDSAKQGPPVINAIQVDEIKVLV